MKGSLIVLSGPSGTGKGTVLKEVLRRNDNIKVSVSCTTRKPRKGEIDGVSYYFKSHEEFAEMLQNNEFLEFAKVFDNYYGTPKAPVQKMLDSGNDVVLEIDVQGGSKIKAANTEAIYIFIAPPSMEELLRRLSGRGTETEEQISKRFEASFNELSYVTEYDYIVVNDSVDNAVAKILDIISADKLKVAKNVNIINKLLREGEEML